MFKQIKELFKQKNINAKFEIDENGFFKLYINNYYYMDITDRYITKSKILEILNTFQLVHDKEGKVRKLNNTALFNRDTLRNLRKIKETDEI